MHRQPHTVPPQPRRPPVRHHNPGILWVVLGMGALAAGFLYYAMLRQASPPLVQSLVGHRLRLPWHPTGLVAATLDSFPSFVHVLGFSLISAGILGPSSPRRLVAVVVFWIGVNIVFELLQGLSLPARTSLFAALPWQMPALERFIQGGIFDLGDLLAAVAGGLTAGLTLALTTVKGETHAA